MVMKKLLLCSVMLVSLSIQAQEEPQEQGAQLSALLKESKAMQHQLSLAVKKSDKQQAEFAKKMAAAAKEHATLKEKYAQLRQDRASLKDELSLAKKEYSGLRKEYTNATKAIAQAAKKYEKDLALALKEQSNQYKAVEKEYVKIDKERFALQEKCSESQQACRELEAKLGQQAALAKQNQQLEKELLAARDEQQKTQSALASLKKEQDSALQENKALCSQARDYDKTARTLHKTAEKYQKECEKLQKHLAIALDERGEISARYKAELAARKKDHDALADQHASALSRLAQIDTVRGKLEKQLKEHLTLSNIARNDMVAHFEDQVKAIESLKKEKVLAERENKRLGLCLEEHKQQVSQLQAMCGNLQNDVQSRAADYKQVCGALEKEIQLKNNLDRENRKLALKIEEKDDSLTTLKTAFVSLRDKVKTDQENFKKVCSQLKQEIHAKSDEPRRLQAQIGKKDARIAHLERQYETAMQRQKEGESLRVALMMRLHDEERKASSQVAIAQAQAPKVSEISDEIMSAAADIASQEQQIAKATNQESSQPMLAAATIENQDKIEAIIAQVPEPKAAKAPKKAEQAPRTGRRRASLWG